MALDNVHIDKQGNMVAFDTFGKAGAFYEADTKKCFDANDAEIDCPAIIRDQLKEPNLYLIIGIIILVVVLGIFSGLYFTK